MCSPSSSICSDSFTADAHHAALSARCLDDQSVPSSLVEHLTEQSGCNPRHSGHAYSRLGAIADSAYLAGIVVLRLRG